MRRLLSVLCGQECFFLTHAPHGASISGLSLGSSTAALPNQLLSFASRSGSSSTSGRGFRSLCRASVAPASALLKQQLAASFQPRSLQGVRAMGSGIEGVEKSVLAKARRLAVSVGAVAGTFGSLVGVGGGVLISPVIANACPSIPQRVISGTSLAAVIATGAAAGSVYWGASQVDLVSAAVVASSALLTAPMGARATHAFNCNTLRGFMAYWLFLAAAAVPLKAYLFSGRAAQAPDAAAGANTTSSGGGGGGGDRSRQEAGAPSSQADGGAPEAGGGAAISSSLRSLCSADLVLAATGAVAGFASGLLGIGGGTIVTPLLAICTDLTQTEILGTSLAAMVLPSALGLAQHFKLGNVDIRMAGMLAAGTFAGGYCGSQFALQLPTAALQLVFSAGMTFLGVKTLKAAAKAAATAAAAAAAKQGAGKAVTAAAPAAAAVAAAKSA